MGKPKEELKELRKEHARLVARLSAELKSLEGNEDLDVEFEEVKTSELPLARRDEQPPLVVDLPEGQKLVVGKLEEGYVIEVASWRGTGRPDSRTSRLMLGVTKDDDTEIAGQLTAPQDQDGAETPKVEKKKPRRFFKRSVKKSKQTDQPEKIEKAEQPEKIKKVKKQRYKKNDFSIPKKKERKPLRRYFGLKAKEKKEKTNQQFVQPTQKASETRQSPKRNVGGKMASWMKNHVKGISAVAVIALVIGLLYAGGVSIVHPRGGAQISMGQTSDSLVVIKRGSHVAVGDKIIINVPGKTSPELVVVQAVAPQSVLGIAGNQLIPVGPHQIRGKVLALFPYFGWFANF